MGKIWLSIVCGVMFAALAAQQNLSVSLADPVYTLLEMAELRGAIDNLPQARPYSRAQILTYLARIEKRAGMLTSAERKVLRSIRQRMGAPAPKVGQASYLPTGRVALSGIDGLPVEFRNQLSVDARGGLITPEGGESDISYHSLNVARIGFAGNISDLFSYQVMAGTGLGKFSSNTYLPYTYTKERDGHTISVDQKTNSHVFDGSGWGVPLQFLGESNLDIFDHTLQVGFNYYRRDFGPGQGNLLYSGNARPAFGLDFRFRPADWIGLNFSSVSLGGYLPNGNSSESSMLTVQQLELFPTDWLYLAVNTGVVWIKRLEPMYLVPFWPAIFTQMITGDYDNLAMELTLGLKFDYLKLYGTFFVDEVQPQAAKELFSRVKQQFAFQLGVKTLLPVIPFTTALFQYTRVEPYAYTHYAQRNPFAFPKDGPGRLNLSWMHDGENLGYPLQPNSDEWQVRLDSMPLPGWTFFLAYRLIRHGDGDRAKGEVEGRTDSVYQATKGTNGSSTITTKDDPKDPKNVTPTSGSIDTGIYAPENYFGKDVSKNFLYDAPYEYIHSIAVGASYRIPQLPVSVGLEYGFAYNDGPVYKGTKGEPQTQHVLGLSLTLFPNF